MTGSVSKILVLTDTNVGGKGGAEQHLKWLAKRFDRAKYKMHIVQLAPTVPDESGAVGCATYEHRPTGSLLGLSGIKTILYVRRLVLDQNYDCVVSFFETSDLITAFLSWFTLRRKRLLSSRRDTGFRHSRLIRLAYKWADPRFDRIIAASVAIRNVLLDQGVPESKISLICNGVDLSRADRTSREKSRDEFGVAEDTFVIACVANLWAVKDHITLLRALRTVVSQERKVHLYLAGDGDQRQNVEQFIADNALGEHVTLLGRIDNIDGLLAAADAFVLSSRSEGMSNAILEAQAARLPIVASHVGGNGELIEDGSSGMLVPAAQPEEFARRLLQLMSDGQLRKKLGDAARASVGASYSMERMIRQYEEVIEG